MPAIHGTSGTPTSVVHGYEILQTLNEGGMGKIYLARQHALNRLVCVKVLSIPAGEDADLCRSRFCREAELLASVSHPHILSIFDFGATADLGLPFLVTEYIEAGDLRRRMTCGQAMPVERGAIHRISDRRRTDLLAPEGDPPPRPQARKCPHADRIAGQGGRLRHRRDARQGRALDPIRPRHGNCRLRIARAAIRSEGRRTDRRVFAGGRQLRALDGPTTAGFVPAPVATQSATEPTSSTRSFCGDWPKNRKTGSRTSENSSRHSIRPWRPRPRKARCCALALAGLIAILLAALGLNGSLGPLSNRARPDRPKRVRGRSRWLNPAAANPSKPNDAAKPPDAGRQSARAIPGAPAPGGAPRLCDLGPAAAVPSARRVRRSRRKTGWKPNARFSMTSKPGHSRSGKSRVARREPPVRPSGKRTCTPRKPNCSRRPKKRCVDIPSTRLRSASPTRQRPRRCEYAKQGPCTAHEPSRSPCADQSQPLSRGERRFFSVRSPHPDDRRSQSRGPATDRARERRGLLDASGRALLRVGSRRPGGADPGSGQNRLFPLARGILPQETVAERLAGQPQREPDPHRARAGRTGRGPRHQRTQAGRGSPQAGRDPLQRA